MPTLADKLAELNVTLEEATAFARSFLPYNADILTGLAARVGITGPMLGELLGYPPGSTSQPQLDALAIDVLLFVQTGRLDDFVDMAEYIGLSAAQIGAAFDASAADVVAVLDAYGIDWTDLPGSVPEVVSVSSTTIAEGESSVQTVTLSGATIGESHYTVFVEGELQDLSGYSLSHGVEVGLGDHGLVLVVPAGVSSFTVTFNTAENTVDETGSSDVRSINMQVAGQLGTVAIADDDTPPPVSSEPFVPYELMPLAEHLRLNGQTGTLATAGMRADILAHADEADYWLLFDATGYAGAEDGYFTNAEVGWSLGHVEITEPNMESLFFGTMIHALKAVDEEEFHDIGEFLYYAWQDGTMNGTELGLLVMELDEAFGSPTTNPYLSDAEIRTAIVEVGVELVGMVDEDPSFFHGLLNVFI